MTVYLCCWKHHKFMCKIRVTSNCILTHNAIMAPRNNKGRPQPVLPTKKNAASKKPSSSSAAKNIALRKWRADNQEKVRKHQQTAYRKIKEMRSEQKQRESEQKQREALPPAAAAAAFSTANRMADLKEIINRQKKKIADLEFVQNNLQASRKKSEEQYTNSFKTIQDHTNWEEYLLKLIPGELTTPVSMAAAQPLWLDKRDFADDPAMLQNLLCALELYPDYADIKIYR